MMAPEAPIPTSLCGPRMYEPTLPPEPGQQVEDDEAHLAEQHLEGGADDEQRDHVEEDVLEAGVQPHRREGPVVLVQRVDAVRPQAEAVDDAVVGPEVLEEEHHHIDGDDRQHHGGRIGGADDARPIPAGVCECRDVSGALRTFGRALGALPADLRLDHAFGADGLIAMGAQHRSRPVGVPIAGRRRDGLGLRLQLGAAHRIPARSSDRTSSATCSGSLRSQRPGELM